MALDLPHDHLRHLFDACDPTGSGFISKESLLDGCQRLEIENLTSENVDTLFAELTPDGAASGSGGGLVTFETFTGRFAAWATQQEQAGQSPIVTRRPARQPRPSITVTSSTEAEEFVGVSESTNQPMYSTGLEDVNQQSQVVSEADMEELVRKFDADTSGVSLRNALTEKWGVSSTHAAYVASSLSERMSESNIKQVLAAALDDLGFEVEEREAIGPATPSPGRPVSASPLVQTPRSADQSPAPSPSSMRRSSVRRRSFNAGRPPMLRNHSLVLDDANIGELKNHGEVRQLWENMKATQPELLDGFANFLDDISQQLEDAEKQKQKLQKDLNRESRDLDRRAMQLDEEAAQQIEMAKTKVKDEERKRLRYVKDDMLRQLESKDRSLEAAMEQLKGLQTEVHKLNAKGKTMQSQYGEMESMKKSLETALEAQRQKHMELQQQLQYSSGQESPSRPPSRTFPQVAVTVGEDEDLTKRVNALTSFGSDHASMAGGSPLGPSFGFSQTTRGRHVSDGEHTRRPVNPAYSPRARRSGSFRQSLKRRGSAAASMKSPRVSTAAVAAAAAEFGDDEGSPPREPARRVSTRGTSSAAASSASDSDLQVDDRQASPFTHRRGSFRKSRVVQTDTELVRRPPRQHDQDKPLPRRTSLSPEDLVPGYPRAEPNQRHTWADVDEEGTTGAAPVDVTQLRDTWQGGDQAAVPALAQDQAILGQDSVDGGSDLLASPALVAQSTPDDSVSPRTPRSHRQIPLASVSPMQDDQPGHGVPTRSASMRVRSNHQRPRRVGTTITDNSPKTWVNEVSDRLDLSVTRPVHMPAVVHPISAKPQQHSTVQYPISAELMNEVGGVKPDRVFKVVFCGDSGVGKTSYIWRLCNTGDEFQARQFSATIGVDFQTKLLNIEGNQTVLQLWDTAGQERFRTFTKQYFRKADGVIVMYDICNDKTFLNVREWMNQIRDATGDSTAVMLLGNKVDLADIGPKPRRKVTYWQGQQLAQQSNALFAEVSAKSGHCVMETCQEMGKILLAAEKEIIDGLLKLDTNEQPEPEKKKSCC